MTVSTQPTAAPNATTTRWETLTGKQAIDRLADDWNRLAHSHDQSPTADAIWMRAFFDAFVDSEPAFEVHALYRGDQLTAVLPLFHRKGWARTLRSVENFHTPYYAFPVDDAWQDTPACVADHLMNIADVVDLHRLRRDGAAYRVIVEGAQQRGLTLVQREQGGDVVIELGGSWEDCKEALPRKMVREASRKARKLDGLGQVTFETATDHADLRETLEACYTLEAKGWKGVSGAPIKNDPRTHRFYTNLATGMAQAGRFALYLLRLDGRLIAYEYCLRAQGKIDQLKPSFDPEFAKYSPGNILRLKILEHEAEEGQIKTYHLGQPNPWKSLWTKRVDPVVRLTLFGGGLRGRTAHLVGPVLRSALKRNPIVRRIRRRFGR